MLHKQSLFVLLVCLYVCSHILIFSMISSQNEKMNYICWIQALVLSVQAYIISLPVANCLKA